MPSQEEDISPPAEHLFSYELKIPKDRVAVLIGKKGEMKKRLEEDTQAKLKIDSKEGDVVISGKDSLGIYTAREVVHAIARGFNPEIATLLLKNDYMLEVVDLRDYATTKNSMLRLKGRVIGEAGKSRRVIEELTETNICVYGKTVSIIGEIVNVGIAKSAIEKLLEGGMHSGIFHELEKKRKDQKLRKMQESFDLRNA
ncbi:MAG TPA: KH domain-containing protein [Candidatus Nanoarchaeia archaeon]|nr:KH domain-containing protein [Candidatus Nanoarchaeia archaeon]